MNSEYITLFRRKMNGLEKVKEHDWHELQILSDKLFNEVEQAITTHPKKNYTKLSSTLNELNAEKQSASRSLSAYKSKLDLAGLDEYTSNWRDATECFATFQLTIANLFILLTERYPKTLHNKALRNEIAKAIPPFHSLGKVVKAKIRMLNEADKNTTLTQITPQATSDQVTTPTAQKLTLKQVALKYVYLEQQITRENATQIAKQYGHNSGDRLYQNYSFYISRANRKAEPTPCTSKKLQNKIELFESVIPLLPENKQNKLSDEIRHLKTLFENDLF
jgi:hypothetical protein